MNLDQIIVASVSLTVQELEDHEVAALFMAMQMGGINPHHQGYDKLASLRTNPDGSMHQATIEALEVSLQNRILEFDKNA